MLQLCQRAGLVRLGHVALDGTKVLANASKHKAMSYGRMSEAEQKLEREIAVLLAQTAAVDATEDAQQGTGRCGDALPAELARRESRLAKIREATAALEQEATAQAVHAAAAAQARLTEREQRARETGRTPKGRPPTVPDPTNATPAPKAQRNFTDLESRIMKDGATKSFVQAYNAQLAVDSLVQIIVAAAVTQQANDTAQLVPMLQHVETNLHRKPTQVSADAGYFSTPQVTDPAVQGIDLYVPPDRQHHVEAVPSDSDLPPPDAPVIAQMRHKLRTVAGQAIYALRKAIVEPVFGQIKAGRDFRRFAFRRYAKVTAEWLLICLTHNLLKLFRARQRLQAA